MKITEEVMSDLLPLYFANECSSDTKKLVEEYFQEHPEFEKESRQKYKDPFVEKNIPSLTHNEEVRALKSTRRWIKARSFVLAFAIFFSLCPFSYYHTDNGSAFLFLEHPTEALIYVPFAVVFWGIYFGIKRRLRTE
ncbi:MAG: hypothetical protein ABR936_07995 [Bacteroidota bacterium]|jgi:hypothetical protein